MNPEKVVKAEKLVKANENPRVFFDIAIGGKPIGKIVMEVSFFPNFVIICLFNLILIIINWILSAFCRCCSDYS